MNNYEAILSSLTLDEIGIGIRDKYCTEGRCEECPIYCYCNKIFDELEKKNGTVPSAKQVISHWLNQPKD